MHKLNPLKLESGLASSQGTKQANSAALRVSIETTTQENH